MADPGIRMVEQPIRRSDLATVAEQQFGDMVKVMVADLWGLNLHLQESPTNGWSSTR